MIYRQAKVEGVYSSLYGFNKFEHCFDDVYTRSIKGESFRPGGWTMYKIKNTEYPGSTFSANSFYLELVYDI